jgi:spermidine synthase
MVEVLERAQGRSGELVLRRNGAHLEVICNGTFLIASHNEESSRALVKAALPYLPGGPLDVLIGGLGMGYALDQALVVERVSSVIVAEYEPVIATWFQRYGGERAARAAGDARAHVIAADVLDVLRDRLGAFDLVALDTDNGPEWLVRAANATIYAAAGVRLACDAVHLGGVVVFWSPDTYPRFEEVLRGAFGDIVAVAAHDTVEGHRHEYVMYVCRRTS